MGARVAGNFCGVALALCIVRMECGAGTARRELDWTSVRHRWIWLHDLCGGTRRAETCAYVEGWTCEIMDEGTSVAWIARTAIDFVSWRVSFWRDADANSDVVADHYRGERRLWRAAATFHSQKDDSGYSAGNHLRRNFSCASATTRRSRPGDRSTLRHSGTGKRLLRRGPARGRIYSAPADRGECRAIAHFGCGKHGSLHGRRGAVGQLLRCDV